MNADSEKPSVSPVPPEPEDKGSGDERQRIRITGGDPWAPRPHHEPARHERRRSRATYASTPREAQRGKTQRKQSSFLGALFAILAFLIYAGTQVMTPSFIVHLENGDGDVLVDGVTVGRTGEVISVSPGNHELIVAPDDFDVIADPQSFQLNFRYSFRTLPIHVQVIRQENIRSLEPDSSLYNQERREP